MPLADWSTGVLEYCKLMKSQTPSTIFKGFRCRVSGVRCQEKETWKLKPPSVLHLDARVAMLLRPVLDRDAGKISKVIRWFSVFFRCQSNIQHREILGIDKDVINSFRAKSKGPSLLGLT
jgi:hypothetical protein